MSHNNRRSVGRSSLVLLVAIVALFAPGQIQGLTPSKPPSTKSRHSKPSNKLAASSLSLGRVSNRQAARPSNSSSNSIAHKNKRNSHNHRRGGRQQQQQGQVSQTSIFVKNLAYEATKKDIIEACRKAYGDIESVWIPRGNDKKGYASVVFMDAGAAKRAISNGRLKVLGRSAYLVPNTKPQDTKGDAFRFLAAFSKGDLRDLPKSKVLQAAGNAGNPRSEKERGILAASLAKVGARDELLKILRWKKAPTSVYNAALSALTVSSPKECKLAKEIVAMAENGPGVNARTYATAIASIKRGASNTVDAVDDLSSAAAVFLNTAIDHGVANHVVYNELISCLGKTGAWKMATNVLDQMFEDEAVEPTEVSLNSAIASCAAAGQLDAAKKIYEESFRKAKIQPTIVTTNSLVSTAHRWIKKRRSEAKDSGALDPSDSKLAMDFVKKVIADATRRGDELDVVSTNTLVSAYGAAGDVSEAIGIFRVACRKGKATTVTANAALSALATSGRVSEASKLVHQLPKLGISSDRTSWNTAIAACGVAGDFATALELLETMPHSPDAHSFASALSAVIDPSEDSNKLQTATSESVHDLLLRADTAQATTTFVLNAGLAALDRLGDVAFLRELFEEGFEERGLDRDVVSYNTVIHALGKSDPIVAVELFLELMQDSNLKADEQSYCAVLSALASGGKHEEALEIFQSSPGHLKKSLALHKEVLRAYETAAQPELALELLSRMQSNGPEPNLVSTTIVINTCAKAGREYEAGFDLFEKLENPDTIAFNSAIALAEKAGDADRAISLLSRMVRDGPSPDAVSFCSAIAACERCSTPRYRTALRLLRESLKAVGPDAGCYIATVQTLAAAGESERALELLEQDCVAGFDDQSRYVLYRTVHVGLAAAGYSAEADRLGREMQEQGLKALAPLARANVGGCMQQFDNQIDSKGSSLVSTQEGTSAADVANKVQDLVRDMDHAFVTSALPLEFQAHSPMKTQEISLANHAEKKALARLLLDEYKSNNRNSQQPLSVEINFKMCADCHAFFKGASGLLQRRITVKEPTMLHVFEDGECSCNNSWRWEERHAFEAAKSPSSAANAATKHRFGRLPPLLKV
jgi:pentatricopeptide repeat protein